MNSLAKVFAIALLLISVKLFANEINNVKVWPASFNPSIGNFADIRFDVKMSGSLSVKILDRDGFVTRTLLSNKQISAGQQHLRWDGHDDLDHVVPDEAWSIKIDLMWGDRKETYFPANKAVDHIEIAPDYYSRENAILAFHLPVACRVHIQAGSAVQDTKKKQLYGPVLKTILTREPRIAGAIAEYWSGFDESGTIYIPDLPNFMVGIAASPLPENSIITTGNHAIKFIDEVVNGRKGTSQFTYHVDHPHHHIGLSVLDDVSPVLHIKPLNATWNPEDHQWITSDRFVEIVGSVEGPSAKNFSKQPGTIEVYFDDAQVVNLQPKGTDFYFKLPIKPTDSNPHIVSLNWSSEYGPTAVNNFRVSAARNPVSAVKVHGEKK
jgi:hypothetical protein